MIRRVAPFAAGDIAELEPVAQQLHDFTSAGMARSAQVLADAGSAFTLRTCGGRILAVCGIAEIDKGYGHGWAFMDRRAGPHMRWLSATVRAHIDDKMATHRRIEIMVRADWGTARKWAEQLGFAREGRMAAAARDGGDMLRFARVNERNIA
ncbi:MAG: hypothetical protein ABJF09_00485 [Qipengyuania citrea]|uniref:hypothetical protein n=1 Tax=Qipengyuania citrea TaxID=225971 RepID=UPI003265F1F3